jgi:hypothetical protein
MRDEPDWPQMPELKRLMTEKAKLLNKHGE